MLLTGGLFTVNDDTYKLFKAIEVKIRQALPQHLTGSAREAVNKELVTRLKCAGEQ